MAVSEVTLPSGTWTKIISNKTDGTFQNQSQWPVMIAYTSADTAPASTAIGFVYTAYQGELKKTFSDMTYTASPVYVWAKPIGGKETKMFVETS